MNLADNDKITTEEAANKLGIFYSKRLQQYNNYTASKEIIISASYKNANLTLSAPKFIYINNDRLEHSKIEKTDFTETHTFYSLFENIFRLPWFDDSMLYFKYKILAKNTTIDITKTNATWHNVDGTSRFSGGEGCGPRENKIHNFCINVIKTLNENAATYAKIILKDIKIDKNNYERKRFEKENLLISTHNTMDAIFSIHKEIHSDWNLLNCLNAYTLDVYENNKVNPQKWAKSIMERKNGKIGKEMIDRQRIGIDFLNFMYGTKIPHNIEIFEMHHIIKNIESSYLGFANCDAALIMAYLIKRGKIEKAKSIIKRMRGY